MRSKTLLSVSLILGAALVQIGCSKDNRSSQGIVAQEKTAGARGSGPSPFGTESRAVNPDTLPEGTPLVVRTTSALSTNSQSVGQTFTAHLHEPLVLGGREIVAKGAEVEGRIVDADKGGRVKERASLSVQLTRLHTADGGGIEISTSTVTRQAGATKGKDAAKIGIGSGIGAAIGAIAGGGKGAAIGAAAGGAAGTGVVLSTRGDPAVIPSETVLHFVLRDSATIAMAR